MEEGVKGKKSVYIETFGCQMNFDDTERLFHFMGGAGFRGTQQGDEADLVILNTCTIRDKAEQKLYSAAGRYRALKDKNPSVVLAISGCLAQQEGAALLERLPYIDIVLGTHMVHRIAELYDRVRREGTRLVVCDESETIQDGEYPLPEARTAYNRKFVSIMRGCDNFCSYCIVPFVRGREVSRASVDVLAEVRTLAGGGTKEVTLVGQNVNSYGTSNGGDGGAGANVSFPALIEKVAEVSGIERIRFVTSHPKDISTDLIRLFEREPKLCRSIHLPIQSGSDRILAGMNRGYTVTEYLSKVTMLKRLYPDMGVTTDVIVGFPGELEADFEATMSVLGEVEFDSIFSFKYSSRPGTLAAGFTELVGEDIKSARLVTLQAKQKEISRRKNKALEGRTLDVLVEGPSKASASELTGRAPCNRVVNFPGNPELVGSIIDVVITEAYSNSLRAIPMERGLQC